jgi:hypothetical protein
MIGPERVSVWDFQIKSNQNLYFPFIATHVYIQYDIHMIYDIAFNLQII